jgi:hypothetical protein
MRPDFDADKLTKGSIGIGCSALLPGINRRPNRCPPGTGPTRLRQEGWLQSRRGLEGNRLRGKAGARRTQKGPGVGPGPQGRRDPRHRTDPLGPLGQVRRAVLNVL